MKACGASLPGVKLIKGAVMAIVDERGRLFGRWNLLDLALLVLLVGLVPLGFAAYALFREQPPRIVSVTPDHLQYSQEFRVTIRGENLRPYMRVSAGTLQARDFYFRSTEEAEIPFASIPPGQYDIVLYDQAQERFRLPKALTVAASGLPATEIVAVGAFGNLDAAGAAKLTAGTDLPGAGTIVSVGRAVPDLTQVFSGSALVGVPIPNALRLPAVVLFKCYVRPQSVGASCVVDDTTVAPMALLTLSTPLGKTPFQVERVRSSQPLESVPVEVRLIANPAVLSLVKPGDVDLSGTANELALLSRVSSVSAVRPLAAGSAEMTVHLSAQLQKVSGRWLYESTPLRVGSPITFRTLRYEASGVVTNLPDAATSSR
jgi:Domain of unknown function (DUF4330)